MKQIWFSFPLAGTITIGSLFVLPFASAQISPDGTLPTQINRQGNVWEITGGGQAGNNLFHSFKDFSIPTGNEAFFNNASDIVNILNRVTGGNLSNIDGLLKANGNANLFLINPAGIIFGKNASLNIGGSFFGSTADGLLFDDGTEFSAINTDTPPLLTINAPIGLNLRGNNSATITSQGNLTVIKDLTLAGGNLDLQGQLQAGENITFRATDTVKIRDSKVNPFIASAGGKLLIEGSQAIDIFTLNHPNSGFFSGSDLVLRSNNAINGDAHYYSGGSFQIQQLDGSLGNLFSLYDPVIKTAGDVSFQSYQGASLHIFAGGKIEVAGNITITDTDTTANSIQENVTLSDGETIIGIDGSSKPTLDLRAGTTAFNPPEVTGELTGFTSNLIVANPTSADLIIGGNITNNGGTVFLTNQYQPNPNLPAGTIQVGGINTSNAFGDGGDVIIDSRGGVNLQGNVDSSAFKNAEIRTLVNQPSNSIITANAGDGGAITIFANDDISGQNLNSFSQVRFNLATDVQSQADIQGLIPTQATATSGNGGAITIKSNGNLNLNILNSSSSVTANANILNPNNFSLINSSLDFNVGNGGKVELNANGNLTTNVIDSSVFAFFNLNNRVEAIDTNGINRESQINLNANATIGSAGAVDLISGGDLNLGLVRSSVGAIARINNVAQVFGTNPALSSINNPTTARANVQLNLNSELEGNGGAIILSSGGAINAGELNSSLFNTSNATSIGNAVADNDTTVSAFANHDVAINSNAKGQNGVISLSALGNVNLDNINFVASTNQATNQLTPIARSLTPNAKANSNVTGTNNVRLSRSDVNLQAIAIETGGNLNLGDIFAQEINLTAAGNLTTGSLLSNGDINLTSTNGSIRTANLNATENQINLNAQQDIVIAIAKGDLNLSNASFISNGGDITIQADNINLNNTKLENNNAGNINLTTDGVITLRNDSTLFTNNPESQINLNAKYVIASPSQNDGNDIIANNEGTITFNVDSVFNLQQRPQNSDANDIVGNSVIGLDETFAIVVPDLDFSEEIQFSGNYLIPEALTKLNCPATTPQTAEDLKIVTSQGVIYPAQGIVRQPDGTVILTAEPTPNTPQRNPNLPVNCN
ncbi:filamentous hemagglutinin family outer membrane protein [Stanieria cyanosphaera PCC 7437]|uniref:Filamentous hemagglutinin family outer membrane protein n=1 Tax=Stanieria cyanosphaera (strain ATCC 29371 / PCC 7437) TaxID=111780 RepID=K9XRA0_STAC7|nr:filamentous hemagglutinin N-terminal domain-containing protein [Stanieria cyanosphaera]AFZ34571.1 filamentous hemagglutinin family outer membrane protein [Stanieria cyanosphaera PCC 7437]